MSPTHMQPVTIPASQPEFVPFESVDFDLSPYEREQAAKRQAHLELHRNEPGKRGWV